ncbi:retention module-containing protein [Shewanella algae]|uniref:retention module-containing protein n=1 Tax=Shewanella algae TaxID=38313 RepID=UPI0031F536F4
MGVAISKQDAVVTNLVGQLKAKDENGNIRDLSIGDLIRNGEEIIFTANDTFTIEYADGTRLTEQNAQPSAQPQPDSAAADVAQFANSGVDAEIAALQAQILAGDDPTANLPATAAGAGTAGNQGDFGYVAVDRDGSELLASAGYDTSGFDQTAITTQEEILLEDLPLTGPTLTSGAATLSDANLPTGTTPSPAALTQTGNLSFSAAAGVASLTLDGVAIVSGGVFNGPVSINTEYGVLTINAVDLINGNISYSFTLNSAVDHSSSDDFSQAFNLILTDLEGNSVGNTLTISVLDDAPSGQDDINSVDEDSLLAISGNLLDNDVQGGDTAQVTAAGSGGNLDNAVSNQSQVSGSYGLLTLNADGSYNYQINSAAQAVQALAQGESLTEVFSYLLTDADGDTSVQTLTITITGTNDVPVISTPQPGEADGAVREAGQFDDGSIDPGTPGVSGQLSASDVDNGAVLIWSGSADSPLGSFSIDAATGAWNYQLDNAAADGLLEGEIRTETFSVTVTDEFGASAEQLVTITIIGTNDAPILSADSSGSITEDLDVINGMLSDSGSLSFTDVDIGDSHVVSSSYNGDVSWSGGALDQATQDALAAGFSADNSGWSYDIANSLVQFLAVGETITLSFTLTVTDAFGASDSQLVTLTINGTNDGPIINPPGEGDADGTVREAGQFDDSSVDPGTPGVSGQLSASDVDNGADLTWSGSADSPLGSFSVDAATGAWNYQLDNAAVDGLLEGEIRTETFTVTVTDEYGANAEQLVTITIIGTNDAPILSADASGAVIEDLDVINGMLSDSGSLSFTDVDIGDSHVVSSSYNGDASWSGGALDQATQDALAAGFSADNAGWSYDIANSLVQFLAVGETITLSFTLTVTDAFGASDSQPVTVTITGTNDAPVLSIDMSGAVTEDVDVVAGMLSDSGDLSFTDVDINDSHSVSSSYNGDASWSGGALDQATQDALAAGFSADNAGWSYDIANSLVQFLAVGETITLSFDVTVDDGNGGTDTDTVTVTITGTNDAPVLSIDMSGAVTEDVDVVAGMLSDSGDLSFTDVDINDSHSVGSSYNGDVLWSGGALDQATQDALAAGFSADNSGWSYDIANSLVQFLAVGETITLSFDVTVDDGNGGTDTDTVTVTITGTNDAPVLSIDMSGAVTEDVDVVAGMLSDSGDLSFTDVDINDSHSVGSSYNGDVLWSGGALDQATQDALAAGFSVDNAGWSYDIANSLVQFLAVGETITLSFDVTVDDGNGGTDTDTVTVTITGTNDAPMLTTTNVTVSEEGLPYGLPDSHGSSDTTDSATANGTIQLQDVDGDALTISLTPPSGITSGGQAVTWQWDAAAHTLTGSVGNLTVMTVVLTPPAGNGSGDWDYQVNLLEPIDHPDTNMEDVSDLTFGVSVDDGNGGTVSGSFVVSIEDDAPYLPDSSPVIAIEEDIPSTLVGIFDLTNYNGNNQTLDFDGFTITSRGFTSSTDHTLTSANIYGDSDGIGVASIDSPYHNIANEVDFREFADGTGVSEEIIIDLDPNTLAFGMKIEFANIFGGELESGVVEFWRDGQLISSQTFSSDASNGDYAANFNVQDGGFDRVVIRATDNGTPPAQEDNSDFTISSIEFTGIDNVPPIAYASGEVIPQWGADGQGNISLAGLLDASLVTSNGESVEVTLSGNTLLGQTSSGDLVFRLEFTPSTGHWDFYQYQTMQSTPDGDLDFAVTITDADGDSYLGNIAVIPLLRYDITQAGSGDQTIILGNAEDIAIGDLDGAVIVPGQNYNIAFMVDSSGSIGSNTLNTMKSQLAQVFDTLKDGVGGQQSGMVKIFLVDFDTHAKGGISVDLSDPNALSILQDALDGMSSGGGTNYEDVFTTTSNWFTFGDAQNNNDATNLAFFITDGRPTYYNANAGGNPQVYNTYGSSNDRTLSQIIGTGYVFGQVYMVDGSVIIDESGNVFSVDDRSNYSREPIGAIRQDSQGEYQYYSLAGTGSSTSSDTTTNSEAGFALLSNLGVTVEAIGMGSNLDENDLASYDTDSDVQTNINANDLADAILGYEIINLPGSDTIDGGAGNDIIFGDVLRFNGIQGQGEDALKAYVADKLGQTEATDAEIHSYIRSHPTEFDFSSIDDRGDSILGGEGDDILFGQGGNDYIFGGTGADYLVGGPGSDRLDAGIDNDRDILIWDAGSADGSTDEVYNFDPNTDVLDLSDILVNEENGVLDDYLDFSFVGGNTIISVDTTGAGGDSVTIVLNGVDLSAEYGTTDEGVIIQSLISDGALLVTQPVVQASLPEPNYTYSSEEQLIP